MFTGVPNVAMEANVKSNGKLPFALIIPLEPLPILGMGFFLPVSQSAHILKKKATKVKSIRATPKLRDFH